MKYEIYHLHTQLDFDECSEDNFGCEHQCINTVGGAFCTCDNGFRLSEINRKSCEGNKWIYNP